MNTIHLNQLNTFNSWMRTTYTVGLCHNRYLLESLNIRIDVRENKVEPKKMVETLAKNSNWGYGYLLEVDVEYP